MTLRIFLILIFLLIDKGPKPSVNSILFTDDFENTFLDLNHWNYDLGDGCPESVSYTHLTLPTKA